MPSTFSTNLAFELPATGEQAGAWGGTVNRNVGTLMEEALGGTASVFLADDTDNTLAMLQGVSCAARNMRLVLTANTSSVAYRVLVLPASDKLYSVVNNTNAPVRLYRAGQTITTWFPVPAGATEFLACVSVDGDTGHFSRVVGNVQNAVFATSAATATSATTATTATTAATATTAVTATTAASVPWTGVTGTPAFGIGVGASSTTAVPFTPNVTYTNTASEPMFLYVCARVFVPAYTTKTLTLSVSRVSASSMIIASSFTAQANAQYADFTIPAIIRAGGTYTIVVDTSGGYLDLARYIYF